jgi:hypothetical protein
VHAQTSAESGLAFSSSVSFRKSIGTAQAAAGKIIL